MKQDPQHLDWLTINTRNATYTKNENTTLNHSPLALDLYAWATYKAYSTSLRNKSHFISYRDLQQQLVLCI